jgi:signal peptidase I
LAKKSANDGKDSATTKARRRRDRQHEDHQKARSWAREWIDALIFAGIVALVIRTFFFGAYRIPTPSMEKTLMTGDFLVVSKLAYGPRTPMTLGLPFFDVYLPGVELPWFRLPGYSEVERNDVVVFNYPIDIAPISRKTNYIKRCVGISGDTLSVRDKILFVNGDTAKYTSGMQMNYQVRVKERMRLSRSKVDAAGAQLVTPQSSSTYIVNATREAANRIQEWSEVDTMKLFVLPEQFNEFARRDFHFSRHFNNHDHMPPVVVPFKGQKLTLTDENWPMYRNIVVRYEDNKVKRENGRFIINGEQTDTYTIKKNYYFMMGDNRDDSEDSRFWGFVPDDHIVGRASMVYFSWDQNLVPRFDRIFHVIH